MSVQEIQCEHLYNSMQNYSSENVISYCVGFQYWVWLFHPNYKQSLKILNFFPKSCLFCDNLMILFLYFKKGHQGKQRRWAGSFRKRSQRWAPRGPAAALPWGSRGQPDTGLEPPLLWAEIGPGEGPPGRRRHASPGQAWEAQPVPLPWNLNPCCFCVPALQQINDV